MTLNFQLAKQLAVRGETPELLAQKLSDAYSTDVYRGGWTRRGEGAQTPYSCPTSRSRPSSRSKLDALGRGPTPGKSPARPRRPTCCAGSYMKTFTRARIEELTRESFNIECGSVSVDAASRDRNHGRA